MMPVYEYYCKTCDVTKEMFREAADYKKSAQCRHCRNKMKRQASDVLLVQRAPSATRTGNKILDERLERREVRLRHAEDGADPKMSAEQARKFRKISKEITAKKRGISDAF